MPFHQLDISEGKSDIGKEQESIPFPEKPFDPGGRPATEKEQGVRYKQMHMKPAFNDGSQRINPEA